MEKFTDEVRAITTALGRMSVSEEALDLLMMNVFEKLLCTLQSKIQEIRLVRGSQRSNISMKDFIEILTDIRDIKAFQYCAINVVSKEKSESMGETDILPTASFLQSSDRGGRQ